MAGGINIEYIDNQLNLVIAELLKKYRIEKGYSLEELSNRINNKVSRQMLFKYENSKARIKLNIFNLICYALDKTPQEMWAEAYNIIFSIDENTTFNDKDQLKSVLISNGVLKPTDTISDEDFERLIKFIENNKDLLIKKG